MSVRWVTFLRWKGGPEVLALNRIPWVRCWRDTGIVCKPSCSLGGRMRSITLNRPDVALVNRVDRSIQWGRRQTRLHRQESLCDFNEVIDEPIDRE